MITINHVTNQKHAERILRSIHSSSWSTESEIDPSDYDAEYFRKSLSQPNAIFLEAFLNDEFAGMASAFILRKPDCDQWLYVDEVDVCKDKQRSGVGTELMKYLFEYAKVNGCDEIWVATEQNNVAAKTLCTSLSPSETESFVGYTYKITSV